MPHNQKQSLVPLFGKERRENAEGRVAQEHEEEEERDRRSRHAEVISQLNGESGLEREKKEASPAVAQ